MKPYGVDRVNMRRDFEWALSWPGSKVSQYVHRTFKKAARAAAKREIKGGYHGVY